MCECLGRLYVARCAGAVLIAWVNLRTSRCCAGGPQLVFDSHRRGGTIVPGGNDCPGSLQCRPGGRAWPCSAAGWLVTAA
eukprot:14685083-Alexandrium_andersonii.AAC.1